MLHMDWISIQKVIKPNEKNNVYLVLNRSESMDESDNSTTLTPSPSFKLSMVKANETNTNVFCCAPKKEEKRKKTPGKAIQLCLEDVNKTLIDSFNVIIYFFQVSSKKIRNNEWSLKICFEISIWFVWIHRTMNKKSYWNYLDTFC